jgi:hypothetical protein
MAIDYSSMEWTKANLLNLIGIDTIIGLTWCIFPMLEFVNALMKFAHTKNVFISNYIVVVKFYQTNIYKMCGNSNNSFLGYTLFEVHWCGCNISCRIVQNWVTHLNDDQTHLAFLILGQSHMFHSIDPLTSIHFWIICKALK